MSKFDLVFERYKKLYEDIRSETNIIMSAPSVDDALDRFWDLIASGASEGSAAAEYTLGIKSKFRGEIMEKSYDGVSIYDKMAEYYKNREEDRAYALIESEWHRAYCEACYLAAKSAKKPMSKEWVSLEDDRTRIPHDVLDGIKIGIDDEFITHNGHGLYPGGFDEAYDNAGCRCVLRYEYISG